MTLIEQEVIEKLRQLDGTGQQKVLDLVRQLTTPHGVDGASLLKYFDRILPDDLAKMEEAIAECEQIDPNDW